MNAYITKPRAGAWASDWPRRFRRAPRWSLAVLMSLAGCSLNVDLLPDAFAASSSPFVISGTTAVLDVDGPCLAWIGENGVTYHLFQGARVDNGLFDRVTAPGARSRLLIAERTDLVVACQVGTIVEVREILEVLD